MNDKPQLLNRKTYKEIKRLDRQQMEGFLTDIYMRGAAEAADNTGSSQEADTAGQLEEISKLLHKELGIGEKRFARISGQVDDILRGGVIRD